MYTITVEWCNISCGEVINGRALAKNWVERGIWFTSTLPSMENINFSYNFYVTPWFQMEEIYNYWRGFSLFPPPPLPLNGLYEHKNLWDWQFLTCFLKCAARLLVTIWGTLLTCSLHQTYIRHCLIDFAVEHQFGLTRHWAWLTRGIGAIEI